MNREQWAHQAIQLISDIIVPHTQLPIPEVKVSVATMKSKKVLGVCHPRSHSSANINEIFISAAVDDSMLHLATLAHETIHAFDDCQSGHKGEFARIARAIGLEGKLTATTVNPDSPLHAQLSEIHELLGDIPHAALQAPSKDKGRNGYKLECHTCDFKANTSKKWAAQIVNGFECPVCKSTNTQITTPTNA